MLIPLSLSRLQLPTVGNSGTRSWLLLGLILAGCLMGKAHAAAIEPTIAPPWSLQTPAGDTVNFPADAHGRPTVLLFWPSWCPYSRALQPYVQAIWEDYRDAGVNVWTINILEKGDPVQTLKDRGLSFPLLLNGDPLRDTYAITRTPWLVVIDGQNRIVYTRPPNPPSPIDVAKKTRETLNGLLGDKAMPLPTSYPPPYDLHLRKPGDQPDRSKPVDIPASAAAAWVSGYLAGVGAAETAADIPAHGPLGRGSEAIAAAKIAWSHAYGPERVTAQAPYRAYRQGDRWVVLGDGLNSELGQGLIAVFEVETGRCVRVADGATVRK